MTPRLARSPTGTVSALLLALLAGATVGWFTLALGRHTDAAGRLALALGASLFMFVSTGWGRGRRGWLQGLAGAAVLAAAMFVHFWSRLGHG